MLHVNSYDRHVAARLLDFFGNKTSWPRRLWTVGTVMGLREVLEGGEAVESSVLSPKAFENLCKVVEITAGQDPGAGAAEERKLLQESLRSCPRPGSSDYLILQHLLGRMERQYLERWRQALSRSSEPANLPDPEQAAQAIASYLLDLGFNEAYLHPWWTFRISHETGERSIADLLADAAELVRRTPLDFEILIPFLSAPGMGAEAPPHWKSSTEVAGWLRDHGFEPRGLRQNGGLLLPVRARDVHSAVEQVAEVVERLSARVNLGTSAILRSASEAWVRNYPNPFPLRRLARGIEICALLRENQLYTASSTSNIDAALELLGSLNEGPPGPAVASGWAAIESLLLGPGDGGDRGVSGERLASLIACSFPRAELTALAHACMEESTGPIADRLKGARTSRERVAMLTQALRAGPPLGLSSETDRLAEARIRALLSRPRSSLKEIEQLAVRALRRMYRQRNLVLHWGRMNAVCLRASLRTAAPLIGAGIDRIAHAWFATKLSPLELAARAKIRLQLLDTEAASAVFALLDP